MDWSTVRLPGVDDRTVAIVLGGGGAIGSECVSALAAQGAHVALVTRSKERSEALAGKLHGDVKGYAADLEEPETIVRLTDRVVEDYGYPSVLINSAAVGSTRENFEEVPLAQARKMFDTNVLGALQATKTVAPHMRQRGGGSIVNVASVAAHRVAPGGTAYAASKASLMSLTRHLAVELGPSRITVNSVSPGQTPTLLRRWDEESGQPPQPKATAPTYTAAAVPVGRRGELADYIGVILFLCSALAGYITGADIPVEGGTRLVRATAY